MSLANERMTSGGGGYRFHVQEMKRGGPERYLPIRCASPTIITAISGAGAADMGPQIASPLYSCFVDDALQGVFNLAFDLLGIALCFLSVPLGLELWVVSGITQPLFSLTRKLIGFAGYLV
jgi:hypothetical protein